MRVCLTPAEDSVGWKAKSALISELTDDVEAVIALHAQTDSWARRSIWSGPVPSKSEMVLMDAHLGPWHRILDQLAGT